MSQICNRLSIIIKNLPFSMLYTDCRRLSDAYGRTPKLLLKIHKKHIFRDTFILVFEIITGYSS